MKKFYEVAITDKITGEEIEHFTDVEEAYRTEDLITGEIVTKLTRKGNRTFKYENSSYEVKVFAK